MSLSGRDGCAAFSPTTRRRLAGFTRCIRAGGRRDRRGWKGCSHI